MVSDITCSNGSVLWVTLWVTAEKKYDLILNSDVWAVEVNLMALD